MNDCEFVGYIDLYLIYDRYLGDLMASKIVLETGLGSFACKIAHGASKLYSVVDISLQTY